MPGTLQLNKLQFAAGKGPASTPLDLEPAAITVVVGPNNAGKSQLLREIERWCQGDDRPMQVLKSLSIDFPDDPETIEYYARLFESPPRPGEITNPGIVVLQPPSLTGDSSGRPQVTVVYYYQMIQENYKSLHTEGQQQVLHAFRTYVLCHLTARLDGQTRFALVGSRPATNLTDRPENHLQVLASDPEAMERFRSAVHRAFRLYPVLDPITEPGRWNLRIHRTLPGLDDEFSLKPASVAYHKQGTPIKDTGDGLQCFCGLLAAVIGLTHKVLLIDEPEAFLHPPLAQQLGSNLAKLAEGRAISLVMATHSANFLLGCIEAGQPVTIVRLTYDADSGAATARALQPVDVKELVASPFARSANVLSALFHHGAVIAEADSDRVFYDEMNRRLREKQRGSSDTLFLNGNGKDGTRPIVQSLRKIGIPAAVITDLDILENDGGLPLLMAACGVPEEYRRAYSASRAALAATFATLPTPPSGGRVIQEQGESALAQADQLRLTRLLEDLGQYGIFPVPGGQLESWFPNLGIKERKLKWLPKLFAAIGHSPSDPHYVQAGTGDIWEFMERIATWINNPARRGTD